ncbi:hypothetical protein BJ878DRAFT_476998 [Calycina marina]|uniref:Uncharacterized protein n=1 Tax=Calycina marina TaxID=1763456 RepID=A0A9P7Z9D0_9HELO|nr:hypothetical protein BJ878DRAFT_476998 [Calycina marina]
MSDMLAQYLPPSTEVFSSVASTGAISPVLWYLTMWHDRDHTFMTLILMIGFSVSAVNAPVLPVQRDSIAESGQASLSQNGNDQEARAAGVNISCSGSNRFPIDRSLEHNQTTHKTFKFLWNGCHSTRIHCITLTILALSRSMFRAKEFSRSLKHLSGFCCLLAACQSWPQQPSQVPDIFTIRWSLHAYLFPYLPNDNFLPLAMSTNTGSNLIYSTQQTTGFSLKWNLKSMMFSIHRKRSTLQISQADPGFPDCCFHNVVELVQQAVLRTLGDKHPFLAIFTQPTTTAVILNRMFDGKGLSNEMPFLFRDLDPATVPFYLAI